MAILDGELTHKMTELWVVYSEDPKVSVPEELAGCGWVPLDKCVTRPGADKVCIRSLSPSEWARYRDEARKFGDGTAMLYATTTATIKHAGFKKRSEVRDWVHKLSTVSGNKALSNAHDLLGMRIIGLTRALPTDAAYEYARLVLGYEVEQPNLPPEADEVSAPSGPESPEPGADGRELVEDLDAEEGAGASGRRKSDRAD